MLVLSASPHFAYFASVRLPPMPPPEATLRPLPLHRTGLPRLPEPPFRRAAPLPRRSERVRPLSRGSDRCGYPHKPLVSYRINRQLSGWIPPLSRLAGVLNPTEPI